LKPEDFYAEAHQVIYRLLAVYEQDKALDVLVLRHRVKESGTSICCRARTNNANREQEDTEGTEQTCSSR
jgi:replicative DNA helicase